MCSSCCFYLSLYEEFSHTYFACIFADQNTTLPRVDDSMVNKSSQNQVYCKRCRTLTVL